MLSDNILRTVINISRSLIYGRSHLHSFDSVMGDGVYLVSGVYLRLVLTSYVFFLVIYSDGMSNQHTAILSPSRKAA